LGLILAVRIKIKDEINDGFIVEKDKNKAKVCISEERKVRFSKIQIRTFILY
jgi:hypothetical protein